MREVLEHELAVARAAYVTMLAAEIARRGAIGEPALRTADGELAREGAWSLGLRVDLVDREAGASVRVESGPRGFTPRELAWSRSTTVRLEPLAWCGVDVEVSPALAARTRGR